MALIRKQISITNNQENWLIKESQRVGISEAEIIRRALDREIERQERLNKKPF